MNLLKGIIDVFYYLRFLSIDLWYWIQLWTVITIARIGFQPSHKHWKYASYNYVDSGADHAVRDSYLITAAMNWVYYIKDSHPTFDDIKNMIYLLGFRTDVTHDFILLISSNPNENIRKIQMSEAEHPMNSLQFNTYDDHLIGSKMD